MPNFQWKVSKLIDKVYKFRKCTVFNKSQNNRTRISFVCMEQRKWRVNSNIVTFFLHIQGNFLNWPLCRFLNKFEKNISFKNHSAGLVNLVKLAWTSRSLYLCEEKKFAFSIQPAQISVKSFFPNDYFKLLVYATCWTISDMRH